MNEQQQAIEQINSIRQLLESSTRVLISGKRMIGFGILFILIPVLEWGTDYFSFGVSQLQMPLLNLAIHIVFYMLLFSIVGRVIGRYYKEGREKTNHPLIANAFAIHKPILIAMIGAIFALSYVGQYNLIFPMVFLFLGILFNLYGRFTISFVRLVSWSYILLGIVYIALDHINVSWLWIVFMCYLGLSYIVTGIVINKTKDVE